MNASLCVGLRRGVVALNGQSLFISNISICSTWKPDTKPLCLQVLTVIIYNLSKLKNEKKNNPQSQHCPNAQLKAGVQ